MKKLIYIFILSFFSTIGGYSQQYNHYSFNKLYDFDVNTVYDIQQSKNGHMWFGTDEGLFQFNGVSFKHYNHPLYNSEYTNIKEDAKGGIWFTNFGGQLFRLTNDSIEVVVKNEEDNDFISVYYISEYPNIFYSCNRNKTISIVNIETNEQNELFTSEISEIIGPKKPQNGKADFYIRKNDGVAHGLLNLEKEEVQSIDNYPLKSDVYGTVRMIYFNDNPTIAVSFKELTFITLNNQTDTVFSHPTSSYQFNSIQRIDDDFYVLTKQSLLKIEDGKPKEVLSNYSHACLEKDNEGNLWIGTLNEGIFIVPNRAIKHTIITDDDITNSVIDNDQNIYFNTSNGKLFKLVYPYRSEPKLLADKSPVASMLYDSVRNRIYIGTQSDYYDLNRKKHVIIDSQRGRFKQSVFVDQNTVLSTSSVGCKIHNLSNKELHVFDTLKPENSESWTKRHQINLRNKRALNVGVSTDGNYYYVDYIDGLHVYHNNDHEIKVLHDDKPILSSAITPADNGVWVGTKERKLLKIQFDSVVKSFELPATVDGFEKWNSYLFAFNNKAVYRIDPKTESIETIDIHDGLQGDNINGLYIVNDTVYAIGSHQIQQFPCSVLTENRINPTVEISKIQVFDETKTPEQLDQLSHDQNNITFHFNAISFRSQKSLIYQYRLKQIQPSWTSTTSDAPQAQFSRIAPGKYTMEYRACNEDNFCSDPKEVRFTIHQAFYQTWWFIILLIISIVTILLLLFRWYLHNERQKNAFTQNQKDLERKVYKARISAIRSQMNPHFMFNALNTIQEFIITNQQNIASEYLADFADLMRKYLEQSKNEKISLQDEIETLEIYLKLENLRFEESLKYSIYTDPQINPYESYIPVMLLQPFIENSIKHGLLHKSDNRKLSIRFENLDENRIKCIIEDNGIGRKASAEINKSRFKHKSFATEALNERLSLLNSETSDQIELNITDLYEGDESGGTRVEIIFNKTINK